VSSESGSEGDNCSEDEEKLNACEREEFLDDVKELRGKIGELLSGSFHWNGVFVKANWSSPQDALAMNPSLHCNSADEIFILLKSSIFVSHDLSGKPFGVPISRSEV